jgi:hypothetical protein
VTDERDHLVHLGGYASIAAVLATADWAGPLAIVVALPIVLAAGYFAGKMLVERLVSRARREQRRAPADHHVPATDGGTESETTGSDRNRPEQH